MAGIQIAQHNQWVRAPCISKPAKHSAHLEPTKNSEQPISLASTVNILLPHIDNQGQPVCVCVCSVYCSLQQKGISAFVQGLVTLETGIYLYVVFVYLPMAYRLPCSVVHEPHKPFVCWLFFQIDRFSFFKKKK